MQENFFYSLEWSYEKGKKKKNALKQIHWEKTNKIKQVQEKKMTKLKEKQRNNQKRFSFREDRLFS